MTHDRLREVLGLLHWSQRSLAELLACDPTLVRRWAAGGAPIPEPVARWLDLLGRAMLEMPPPDDWRVRPRAA